METINIHYHCKWMQDGLGTTIIKLSGLSFEVLSWRQKSVGEIQGLHKECWRSTFQGDGDGPDICQGDGQMEAPGVPAESGHSDALLRHMPPDLTTIQRKMSGFLSFFIFIYLQAVAVGLHHFLGDAPKTVTVTMPPVTSMLVLILPTLEG